MQNHRQLTRIFAISSTLTRISEVQRTSDVDSCHDFMLTKTDELSLEETG